MADKTATEQKIEARMQEVQAEIDKLDAKAKGAEAGARQEIDRRIEELRSRRAEAEQQLETIRQAGEQAWEDMRQGAERALDEMTRAIENAQGRFDR